MSELAEIPKPQELVPRCAHCQADPIQFAYTPAKFGEFLVGVLFCSQCRAMVGTFLIGTEQPRITIPN